MTDHPEDPYEEQHSARRVTVWLVAAILAIGWAFAAMMYTQANGGGPPFDEKWVVVVVMAVNAVAQLPKLFSVLVFTWNRRFWLLIIVAVLLLAAMAIGWKMRALEREWAEESRKRRRRSRPVGRID